MGKKNNQQEDFIFLYSKKVKISKLVASFTVIPSTEIVKYLKNKEIYFPYYIHKAIIRKNIAPAIASAESANKFSDEMRFRLKWFDKFTIFQLEKLAENYNLAINVDDYKKDFWDIVVRNRTDLGINNLEFIKLQNLSMKYAKEPQEDYKTIRHNFEEIYFEPIGYFDGTELEEAIEVLTNSTTLTEIHELGMSYGVEIPRRINKKQLVEIVAFKLDFNEEQIEEISKKSILEIERYAKRRKINVSIELKKNDMIEYILIKISQEVKPKYSNSLKIFAGMNVEEYLYSIKFEEISDKMNENRSYLFKRAVLIFAAIAVVGLVAYVTYSQFFQ